jgi:hypothetical protein
MSAGLRQMHPRQRAMRVMMMAVMDVTQHSKKRIGCGAEGVKEIEGLMERYFR